MFKKIILGFSILLPINALAHLTWIEAKESHLSLSTGHNFPAREISVGGQYVESILCTAATNPVFKLEFDQNSIRYPLTEKPVNCLARLKTTPIALTPAQGVEHLAENRADPGLIAKAKVLSRFNEVYFKTAQLGPIALQSPLYDPAIAQFVYRPDDPETLYVYRNGLPVAGLSIGLEYPQTPITLWSKTDADGKIKLLLRPKTRALLRALIAEEANNEFSSQFLSVILNP